MARLKGDGLRAPGLDRWYVTDGLNAVGPVRRDLLVRGIEAGRVPLDSFIRHEAWKVWRPLADFAESSGVGEPTVSGLSTLLDEDDIEVLSDSEVVAEERSSDGMSLPFPIEDGPTNNVSRDLLGGDRATLESYLDDDEETIVPNKPGAAKISAKGEASRAPSSKGRTSKPGMSKPGASKPASSKPALSKPGVSKPGSSKAAAAARPSKSGSLPGASKPGASKSQKAATPTSSKASAVPTSSRSSAAGQPRSSREGRPSRPVDPSASDELSGAEDLSEALLLLLNGLVQRTHADVAILHRMADDGATTVCAHGPKIVDTLGTRTRLLDPAVVAAAGGTVVVAEPAPGPAGDATLQRLRKSGVDIEGAVMFPLRPKKRLLGFVELGKEARFSFKDLVSAEELIHAFVRKAEAGTW